MWKGKWNDIHIVGKKLAIKIVNKRISRDFSEEYSKLRFVLLLNFICVNAHLNQSAFEYIHIENALYKCYIHS